MKIHTPALALAAALGACAAKPVPPVLSLEAKTCDAAPLLTASQPFVIASNKPVTVAVDETNACLDGSSGKSAYVLFRLPDSPDEYLVSVASVPQGQSLFSPRVSILDTAGSSLREMPRDSFQFHGTAISVNLRIHAGERYLLVLSDPATTGMEISQIVSNTMGGAVYAGGAYVPVYTGSEATVSYVNAHNGKVTVAATPLPK